MNLRLKMLAGTTLLALGALTATNSASASTAAGCSAISPTYMDFQNDTPVHSWYSGSSSVIAWISTPKLVEASCISTAGKQWWKFSVGSGYGYVYDGYRIYPITE
ncbi:MULTISPECIES: hypothetical protein [Streptosporangium]|uniref:SH3 domain-containing protein n=1 Tax=Streptosporangium brasiliense TaxID=47480 RepID=A0ABT9QX70_9ACTN|nr:hypothetical protein [Streptosporangium brasiliense]MDP9861482.1 hypothetical protein [Streptosporangium brasiliense]